MNTCHVDFYFDLSSPWTYMAFFNYQKIIKDRPVNTKYIPVLVGGIFNSVNKGVYASRQEGSSPKTRFYTKSIKDWARWSEVTLNFPSPHHPLKSVIPMRFCAALQEDQSKLLILAKQAFLSYFVDQKNLDDSEEMVGVADGCGLNGKEILQSSQTPEVKARLRSNTEEAIERGAFGSPTFFANKDDMYFGNDQLPLLERAIKMATTTE